MSKIIENIKKDLSEQQKVGMLSKGKLEKALAYVDRNSDEMIDMVDNQGCSISEAADMARDCAGL